MEPACAWQLPILTQPVSKMFVKVMEYVCKFMFEATTSQQQVALTDCRLPYLFWETYRCNLRFISMDEYFDSESARENPWYEFELASA